MSMTILQTDNYPVELEILAGILFGSFTKKEAKLILVVFNLAVAK